MSSYVKISYKSKNTNIALKKCIEYIGLHYGNNKKYDTLYKSGKTYLAKKVRGATKTSVNNMVCSKNIKNSQMKEWKFKKCSYDRTYRYIIYIMLKKDDNKDETLSLLRNLYLELKENNSMMLNILSDILVFEQKDMLDFAIKQPQYESSKKVIDKILKEYEKCDEIYKCYLD